MKITNKKAFTLIEIMLSISITFILMIGIYFAYEKVRIKSATQQVQDEVIIAYEVFEKYSDPRSYDDYWNTPNNPNQGDIKSSIESLFTMYINELGLPEDAQIEGTLNINYRNKYGSVTALNTKDMVIRDVPKSECPILLDRWNAYHGLPSIDSSGSTTRERCFDGYYAQGVDKITLIFNFENVKEYSIRR